MVAAVSRSMRSFMTFCSANRFRCAMSAMFVELAMKACSRRALDNCNLSAYLVSTIVSKLNLKVSNASSAMIRLNAEERCWSVPSSSSLRDRERSSVAS